MFWSKWLRRKFVPKEFYISLGCDEYESLIRGGIVTVKTYHGQDIKIGLKDIGWYFMKEKIWYAEREGVRSYDQESIEVRQ